MRFVFHFEALPPRRRGLPPGAGPPVSNLTRHDGLPAFGHRDVLDDDPLRAAGAKPLHGRHPGLIRARHPGNGAGQPRALDVRPLSRFIVVMSRSMRSMQRLS